MNDLIGYITGLNEEDQTIDSIELAIQELKDALGNARMIKEIMKDE